MSETKAAFAERAIRSLKNVLYRYIEDYRHKYYQPQFVTTLITRRNRSIEMKPSNGKNSDFMSVLYSKPIRDFNKPKFYVGHRVRISKQNLPFRKGYKPQFTNEIFKIVALATRKPPTYDIQDEQGKVIKGKFYEKEFLPDEVNLEGQWEVAIPEISYPSVYQNVTDGEFLFYDAIYSKTTTACYLEPGLYSSNPDIVESNEFGYTREKQTQ